MQLSLSLRKTIAANRKDKAALADKLSGKGFGRYA
jgi:hypothetical protein